jgi:glycosyltransferase involved in cell wall biosynthesis
MRPLHVCFVADTENWGGAEVWLVHHLRRAENHGVEASVVCAQQVADRFRACVPPERLAVVPLARHAAKAPYTEAALRSFSPDLVHVNLVDPASNSATLAAALSTAPTTATLHLPGATPDGAAGAALADLYRALGVLLTPSEEGAALVRSRLAEPVGGVVVTCNGVDVPAKPHGAAGGDPPRVGVHARLTRQKGIDVLLEALRRVVDSGADVSVAVAGTGRDEARLRAAGAGLPVRFVGWVADPRSFLSSLDVFCLPSRAEALPLALLEAMAEGLPCVATDVGDIHRRVGGAVVVVPPEHPDALAAALLDLLRAPSRRAALGARARSCAERCFDASDMVHSTYRTLRSLSRSSTSVSARDTGPAQIRPQACGGPPSGRVDDELRGRSTAPVRPPARRRQ